MKKAKLIDEDTVSLPIKEYVQLRMADHALDALNGAGVDNWEGYEDAWENSEPEPTMASVREELKK